MATAITATEARATDLDTFTDSGTFNGNRFLTIMFVFTGSNSNKHILVVSQQLPVEDDDPDP
jgi:hypothetical protein